jgi:hypothetical protein
LEKKARNIEKYRENQRLAWVRLPPQLSSLAMMGAGQAPDHFATKEHREHKEEIFFRALCALLWPFPFRLFPATFSLQNVKEQARERHTTMIRRDCK